MTYLSPLGVFTKRSVMGSNTVFKRVKGLWFSWTPAAPASLRQIFTSSLNQLFSNLSPLKRFLLRSCAGSFIYLLIYVLFFCSARPRLKLTPTHSFKDKNQMALCYNNSCMSLYVALENPAFGSWKPNRKGNLE